MLKLLTWLIYPMTLVGLGFVLAGVAWSCRRLRLAKALLILSVLWLFAWGTEAVPRQLGLWLERPYPPKSVSDEPHADVIVVLGGGMGPPRGDFIYPELFAGADRVWHAARLYRAGKAAVIIPTGCSEKNSSVVLLQELGVPEAAIDCENQAKNTIENGLFVREKMRRHGYRTALLVTSGYHMRRAEMIFRKLGVPVVPVAVDQEMTYGVQPDSAGRVKVGIMARAMSLLPNAAALDRSACYLKEVFGYWGDSWRVGKEARP